MSGREVKESELTASLTISSGIESPPFFAADATKG
jgi:hypothetical protein